MPTELPAALAVWPDALLSLMLRGCSSGAPPSTDDAEAFASADPRFERTPSSKPGRLARCFLNGDPTTAASGATSLAARAAAALVGISLPGDKAALAEPLGVKSAGDFVGES